MSDMVIQRNARHLQQIAELESERDRLKAQVTELEQRPIVIQRDIVDSMKKMKARLEEASWTLNHAQHFISYVKFELKPGKATIGDQYPRQDDADAVMTRIEQYFAARDKEAQP